ncbi:MAG: Thiol:disulfide interchange protein DsbD [Alphaproteobacteria bacterium MarineAlpha5_Bin6]|nr:MAG: Thiol:disulfide interchange protein DsbD [Alphaproteobacteria bacterium MarineAlpha5_Bin6]|tara:strand:+ start:3316 stop:5238 length:1923 start_codon:yes stop_codon:yes gene_type:complete
MKKILNIISFFLIFYLSFSFQQSLGKETEWSNGIESQVRLISPLTHNNGQKEIFFGLQYKLQPGWKTYWKSPGEGGFPQEINWEFSKNLKKIELMWPTPSYFEILGFTSIGYEKEVLFPLKIEIEDITKETQINLQINYLVCEDICIPGNANLKFLIPPGKANFTEHYFTIQKAKSLVPRSLLSDTDLINFSSEAYEDKNNISIIVIAESKNIIQDPEFFIHSEFGLPVVKPIITFSPNLKKITAKFNYAKSNIVKKNFVLDTIFKNNYNTIEYTDNIKVEKISNFAFLNNSILYIFVISILGGMILNLMPCVLPVLSIKILSVLKSSSNKSHIGKSFLITSLGIISSFAILALILIFVRALGINIGWGMQFQQPLFLIFIAIVLLIFSLNIFGFFEFKIPAFANSQIVEGLTSNNYFKDFFNGFFATILATPCSAPFVGTALTVAFTQSAYTMLGIFILMGFGMAFPYLVFSFFPNLAIFLPKPGIWMNYIKYFLGILLVGTFIWILSILFTHISFFDKTNVKIDPNWINLTLVDLESLKQDNNIIFIDITADWCATCQYNKINVINSKEIIDIFEKNNVIKVKGDWTKPNDKIANFIQKYNKFGIPFNIVYSKNNPEGIILSEILTKKEVLETIQKIK